MDPVLYFSIGGVLAFIVLVFAGVVLTNSTVDIDFLPVLVMAAIILLFGWLFILIMGLIIGVPVCIGVGLVRLKRWLDTFEKEL